MVMFVTRDKDGALALYRSWPTKNGSFFNKYDNDGWPRIPIHRNNFPEVTFENSPQEVELVIKK